MAMNREQKRMMQRQGQLDADGESAPRTRKQPQARPKQDRTSPGQFIKEVRGELRKVAWPTRSEVINYSIVVIVGLVFLTALIALLDFGFGELVLRLFDA
ncbi:MAG: preprotein translocase subunit SecE [Actinomycetia bacterium]|nr:preprotein translocase subunit SecE [Actinomycetes bacterium]